MPNEQLREDNTRDVLAAALALFSECGVERTTIPQISKRAGVSVRSIYRYFENKDALVAAVMKAAVSEMEDAIRQLVWGKEYKSLRGADQVVFLCQKMLDLAREKCELQVCLNEAESYLTRLQVRDIFSLSNDSDNTIIQYFKAAFVKGVQDETIEPEICKEESDFITLVLVFRGFYNRIATVYSNEELCSRYDPKKAIEKFLASIRHSISKKRVREQQ